MPLLAHTPAFIEVDVTDRVFGDTLFKQRARFVRMEINQQPGGVTVFVRLRVSLYANDGGNYGEAIVGKGITDYEVTLVADNNCAVDAATGAVLYQRVNETLDEWLALLETKPETLMLQGDFFENLLHSTPVEIEPLLRNFMLQANAAPFNKFS